MTEDDFLAIEEYLGKPLPLRYREIMKAYPFEDEADSNLMRALYSDVESVLSANAELLEGEWADKWSTERFAIGCSPVGDTYSLDLTDVSPAVFVWDHETHETSIEAPDLDSFIADWKKWEAEARTLREQEQPKHDQLEKQILMSCCLVGSSIVFIIIMIIVALLQGRGR